MTKQATYEVTNVEQGITQHLTTDEATDMYGFEEFFEMLKGYHPCYVAVKTNDVQDVYDDEDEGILIDES